MTGKDPSDTWNDCPECHGATKEKPQVRLHLVPKEKGGLAGQDVLTIVNPPTLDPKELARMIGMEIWGGAGDIMVGERKLANRIMYTRIELIDDFRLTCRTCGEWNLFCQCEDSEEA